MAVSFFITPAEPPSPVEEGKKAGGACLICVLYPPRIMQEYPAAVQQHRQTLTEKSRLNLGIAGASASAASSGRSYMAGCRRGRGMNRFFAVMIPRVCLLGSLLMGLLCFLTVTLRAIRASGLCHDDVRRRLGNFGGLAHRASSLSATSSWDNRAWRAPRRTWGRSSVLFSSRYSLAHQTVMSNAWICARRSHRTDVRGIDVNIKYIAHRHDRKLRLRRTTPQR